ncbi:hypothetical protein [Prauserella endophytica]|uniref:Uncharacterized protein n=2 Tax=Prauserella TaxID=142577 RepID=A0ABY2SCZ9_9PSEU|nr:hypothetical protein [Prauserella endophytica]PXY34683.1 hypothetical protein BAY59_04005 [Prauserella coralliicola]TKG73214.1 hypothetical protein FCN18_01075 [Prauserella endophytica]
MRIATSIAVSSVTAVAFAAMVAGCGGESPDTSSPKVWQTGTRTPTVTLTEPAGGPTRDRT